MDNPLIVALIVGPLAAVVGGALAVRLARSLDRRKLTQTRLQAVEAAVEELQALGDLVQHFEGTGSSPDASETLDLLARFRLAMTRGGSSPHTVFRLLQIEELGRKA